MKVTGFMFVRNAVKFDYPVVESITSILPLCDEFIVALGDSDDATAERIASIASPKIKTIHTVWDKPSRQQRHVLAAETDKALAAVAEDTDWAFYIQADEVLHEKFYETLRQAMIRYKDDNRVDGLLFNYLHFYGAYCYVGDNYSWYRREVRIIRKNPAITSYRDAQGFRKNKTEKLNVKHIDASIYHYGWVRPPRVMQSKQSANGRLSQRSIKDNVKTPDKKEYDYSKTGKLRLFEGTHPAVMSERIKRQDWQFEYDASMALYPLKDRIKKWVERKTGWRIGEFRNYKII